MLCTALLSWFCSDDYYTLDLKFRFSRKFFKTAEQNDMNMWKFVYWHVQVCIRTAQDCSTKYEFYACYFKLAA